MLLRKTACLLAAGVLCTLGKISLADEARPLVHPLFSNHAVLQRDMPVPVWGWAAPGEKVTVTFGKQQKSTVAGADGKWMVKLGALRVSDKPGQLTVQAGNLVTNIEDVLVGDVWLCSGQSNMEMGIGACDVPSEISAANYPNIRLLTVPKRVLTKPADTLNSQWLPCNPTNMMQGVWAGFSATGYFFGRKVHQETGVPIGLIHSSWGGTVIEAWTSYEALSPISSMRDRLDQFAFARDNANAEKDYPKFFDAWCQKNDPGSSQGWCKPETDLSGWKTMNLPTMWEQAGLPDFDGIVWFAREVEIPAAWAGKELTLHLGPIDDVDTTWVNGIMVGQMNLFNQDRVYKVPAGAVKAGKNVITVRVLDTGGNGGLYGTPEQMSIGPDKEKGIALAGAWRMQVSAPIAKLAGIPRLPDSGSPNTSTVLYNGMIAPLLPFALRGAIWYQGESNAGRAEQYRELLPTMIQDWKKRFGVSRFPFYIVQLAAFTPTNAVPRDSDWAELREAQAMTAKKVAHSGLAVAIDIGDAQDIHPKNKMEVGRRLALCALDDTYRMKVESSGPTYKKMRVEGNTIRLRFNQAVGLTAKGDKLTGFAIAGEDKKFVWADARIDGDSVVVSAPSVSKPVAVRYAWDTNPVCNLYNKAGLPAVPFRTDDWQMITHGQK